MTILHKNEIQQQLWN